LKLALSFGHGLLPSEVVIGSKAAEEMGFDSVWVSESTGYDSLSVLGSIASRTEKVGLGSGIVNIYSRTPTQLAMAAATLDELSHGRFTLGVGASSRSVVSGWHRLEYKDQLAKMKDTVEEIRRKLRTQSSLIFANQQREIPIFVAAVQHKMVTLSKEISEGVLFFMRPISSLRNEARNIASRNFKVNTSVITCISNDSKLAEEKVRRIVTFYLSFGMAYSKFIVKNGILSSETVKEIRGLWLAGKREEASRLIPKETLDQVTIFGTPADSLKKIEDYARIEGLSTLALQFSPGESSLKESFKLLASLTDELHSKE
jgi:5,10-methylenetetrahydromethanopterin reductase